MLGLAALAAPLPGLCAALLISVTFGAPAVLMWAQQYKQYDFSYSFGHHSYGSLLSEIRGPWDAATPRGFEGESEVVM